MDSFYTRLSALFTDDELLDNLLDVSREKAFYEHESTFYLNETD